MNINEQTLSCNLNIGHCLDLKWYTTCTWTVYTCICTCTRT